MSESEHISKNQYQNMLVEVSASQADPVRRLEIAGLAKQDYPEEYAFCAEYSEALGAMYDFKGAEREILLADALMKKSLKTKEYREKHKLVDDRVKFWRRLQRIAASLKISACLIVKNEETNIRGWLEKTSIYADEIIITDTGSTDDTVKLANGFNDKVKVFHFDWINDFSAARNFTLDKATGSWIVFLDADDEFYYPDRVRNMIAYADYHESSPDALLVTVVDVDADKFDREIHRYPITKVFRRDEHLRYENIIHECIRARDGKWNLLTIKDWMSIRHTGYSTSLVMDKVKRDYELLMLDIAENGEQPRHYRYLADCYSSFKDYESTLKYALKAINEDTGAVATAADLYGIALSAMERLKYSIDDMLGLTDLAIEAFPMLPEYYARKAMLLFGDCQYELAEPLFRTSIKLYEENRFGGNQSSGMGKLVSDAYSKWGFCLQALNNQGEADRCWLKAIAAYKFNEDALCWWAESNMDRPCSVIFDKLHEIIEPVRENMVTLSRIFEKHGFYRLYSHYRELLIKNYGYADNIGAIYDKAVLSRDLSWIEEVNSINLPYLFASLLSLPPENDLRRDNIALLPDELKNILVCFDKGEALPDGRRYLEVKPYVEQLCSAECYEKYLRLSEDMKSEVRIEASGQEVASAEVLLARLEKDTHDEQAFRNLYSLMAGQLQDADIIEIFNALYDREKDADFLVENLQKCKPSKVYLYYSRYSTRKSDEFFRCWAAGRYDGALAVAADRQHLINRLAKVGRYMKQPDFDANPVIRRMAHEMYLDGGNDNG